MKNSAHVMATGPERGRETERDQQRHRDAARPVALRSRGAREMAGRAGQGPAARESGGRRTPRQCWGEPRAEGEGGEQRGHLAGAESSLAASVVKAGGRGALGSETVGYGAQRGSED